MHPQYEFEMSDTLEQSEDACFVLIISFKQENITYPILTILFPSQTLCKISISLVPTTYFIYLVGSTVLVIVNPPAHPKMLPLLLSAGWHQFVIGTYCTT